MKRISRISLTSSFALFIVLCASCSYWVLQFMQPQTRKISAPAVVKPVADVDSVAGLFGGALAVNTNYQLRGIVLANPQSQSGAIIAVDGKPAQAFRVNAEISPGIKLTDVQTGYVMILDNGVSKRIDLPQDAKPMAGVGADIQPSRYPGAPGVNGRPPGPLRPDNVDNKPKLPRVAGNIDPPNANNPGGSAPQ